MVQDSVDALALRVLPRTGLSASRGATHSSARRWCAI